MTFSAPTSTYLAAGPLTVVAVAILLSEPIVSPRRHATSISTRLSVRCKSGMSVTARALLR